MGVCDWITRSIHLYEYIYIYVFYLHIFISIFIFISISVYICVYIYISTSTSIYIYLYTSVSIYIIMCLWYPMYEYVGTYFISVQRATSTLRQARGVHCTQLDVARSMRCDTCWKSIAAFRGDFYICWFVTWPNLTGYFFMLPLKKFLVAFFVSHAHSDIPQPMVVVQWWCGQWFGITKGFRFMMLLISHGTGCFKPCSYMCRL